MAAEPISAIANALGEGFKLADGVFGSKSRSKLAEKQGFQDMNSRLMQLRQQREALRLAQVEQEAKNKRITLIVAGAVLAIFIVVVVFKSTR